MATGRKVYEALQSATAHLPRGSRVKVQRIDARDLMTLTAKELVQCGFDRQQAEAIASEFRRQSLAALGREMGLQLEVARFGRSLVPDERLKETAGRLESEPETLEETFRILRSIRHPEQAPE
jgi:hypothetical protein